MKKMIHKISLFICLLIGLSISQVNATHILGSELTYTCVSSNQYNVQLVLYADCSGISLPANETVSFSSASCSNNFNATLSLTTGFPVEITPLCPTASSFCNGGSVLGVKKYVYSSIVTIPASCTDWEISWSTCCRSGAIGNVSNANTTSLFTLATLNSTLSSCNNAPNFIDTKPHFTSCITDTTYLNFGAFDFDGDSLTYALVAAQTTSGAVSYNPPFNAQNPFSGSTHLDSETGLITLIPNIVQTGLIVVRIDEFRNGVKIGEIFREVTINIYNCNSNSAPKITALNGASLSGNIATFSTSPGAAFSVNATTYDVEVAAGTQTLTASWNNLPNGAVGTTGASPTLSWTPTTSDIGTHYVYLTLSDDACPLMRQSAYAFKINVGGPAVNNAPIAIDDYYTMNANSSISLDLLSNDSDPDGNNITLNTTLVSQPTHGVTIQNGNQLTYTTVTLGGIVDTIRYSICDDGVPSLCDTATAYIIIDYPINNNVAANIAAGTTTDLCFNTSGITNIGSITLQGSGFNNATINSYDLTNGCINIKADSITTDSATFLICDNTTGVCAYNTIVLNIEQGVWPGDTDVDQYVDNFDLLNIGLAYGNTGTPRSPASIAWDGYLTPDWTKVTPVSNINFKHIDSNGDGIIDVQDTVAISTNWNSSYTYNKSGSGTIPLYIDPITPNSIYASLPIMLGDAAIPANDIYGIAFTISYDTSLIEPNTIDISIDTSWLGTVGTDLIKIHKDFYNDGMVQVAITRTDGVDISGSGRIGNFIFTIQDDIMQRGVLKFPFKIINVKTIDANELEVLTNPMQTEIDVIATNTNQSYLAEFINIFPNPVSDVLNIQSEDLTIEQITLTNIAGQVIETRIVNNYQSELYMQNLPNGIYTLSIMTNKGLVHKKVNILK